ncbi:glycosyltransferase family 39 protein [Mastigocladopsis repens]|uniref:glycosyltransferase family 39 protein n=1 Tax=Mastigocladopsis repens TaxID=221287 RepID=UPI0005272740|nr:glycosyltransferase family 39 protein [Mastigocladopsis repens]
MNGKLMHSKVLPPTWLRFLVIVLLALGVFFRFVNLDRKVYWFDETFTSLRVAGYTASEANEQICNGQEINAQDLQKYQRLAPEKTLTDTIKSLALEDSQHPPLYYVLTRFGMQWFGSSVAVTRGVSALMSLLAFPCMYWLCRELFESSLVGWVAIGLLAVSPLHVLYAQEAREYSLWSVTILLSSAALLWAMRLKTKLSWGIYALSVALGLYTFLFSGLVMIAHGVYVVALERFRLTKKVIAYFLASSVGILAFTPWLVVVITNFAKVQETTSWMTDKVSRLLLMKFWAVNLSYFLIDFDYDLRRGLEGSLLKRIIKYLIPFLLVFVGYSIYFLWRRTPKRVWLFVFILIGITALPLVISDFIFGGVRSQIPRYFIPAYLGIQLAVSYLLATQIIPSSVNIWRRRMWQIVMVGLVGAGVISCGISSQAETWWLKSLNLYTPQMVRMLNQASHPILISSCEGTWAIADELSLSYLLSPKVRIQLVNESHMSQISHSFNDVFLYNPPHNPLPQTLEYKLEKEQQSRIGNVYFDKFQLWKLAKN